MIKTEDITYTDGDVSCLGFLAYEDEQAGKRPGVLLLHEAWGLGKHVMDRARMLADIGYVAFAADLYGDRRLAHSMDDLESTMGPLRQDRLLLRKRAQASLSALASQPRVDPSKLFAVGFCFGGATALELARAGADLLGVVSFHGTLETTLPAQPGAVKASVLVCTGADDPMAPPEQRTAFEDEMRKAQVDWQLIAYGNTVHSFTNPDSDGSFMPAILYNEQADKRSWRLMRDFFEDRLNAR